MSPSLYESAEAELARLIASLTKQTNRERNEATTRLHLVDRLLKGCLGWADHEIDAERHVRSGYVDYMLGAPRPLAVVEAKREAATFELPAGFSGRICPLKVLLEDPGTKEAISQALRYCADHSVGVGAISNGHSTIAFLGSRQDGVPPQDGRAVVFRSLEDIQEDFRLFWDCLSQPGVHARYLHRTLKEGTALPPPEKLSAQIFNFPRFKARNHLATELQTLGEFVLQDSLSARTEEDQFLRECYYASGSLPQYAEIGRHILESRYSASVEGEGDVVADAARTKSGVSEAFADTFATAFSTRPIVLLGDVGVGKSIFIRHFVRIDARDVLREAIVLYADFHGQPALQPDLRGFVLKQFSQQLRDEYDIDIEESKFVRGVYNADLNRFKKGIFGDIKDTDAALYRQKELELLAQRLDDREGHLKASLEQIVATSSRQIVVFLDNIDQHALAFQEEVFRIGQAWAETWPGTVFVSLRPDTFNASRHGGALTAYQPRVFTIAPPRIDRVVSKRLEFVLSRADEAGRFVIGGVSLESSTLVSYLTVLLKTFKNHDPTKALIENLSGGNVRRALDFVMTFLGSGHVNTEKILKKVEQGGRYLVPPHEFLRALLFGDYEYFDPESSPLANLFDISRPDAREHFLAPMLIGHIQRLGNKHTSQGFVDAAAPYDLGGAIGFDERQVGFALDRAVAKSLLEAWPDSVAAAAPQRYRVTTAGAYTISKLAGRFAYLDAVVTDTPIVDPDYRERVRDVRMLSERLDRAEAFVTYLTDSWEALQLDDAPFDWSGASVTASTEIVRLRQQVVR